jgi:hypothetical protein
MGAAVTVTGAISSRTIEFEERVARLNAAYRAGGMHVHVPSALQDASRPIEDLISEHMPVSHAAFEAASHGLFFSLPVAFDPAEAVGPYLAVVDRDSAGLPYRFLDMGSLIATHAFGENDPHVVRRCSTRYRSRRRATPIPSIRPPCRCVSRRRSIGSRQPARRVISSSTPAPRRWKTRSNPCC